MMQDPLLRLRCGVNSYAWGKKGHDSVVARFAAATASNDLKIESNTPYSELWMGTHPSNPSRDATTGRSLLDIIEDNQALISSSVASRFGLKLPFLFKILSINQALSIQAHPNKLLAEQLHAKDPQNYPDDNHKPEMVIALTPFEGLCGFRPIAEILHFLDSVPPLRALVGEGAAKHLAQVAKDYGADADADRMKSALKRAFGALMTSSTESMTQEVSKLVDLANNDAENFAMGAVPSMGGKALASLVNRLHKDFGDDIGLFVLFFLNFITLAPGEAMFLEADNIHAYISGDVAECMAASDNVIRAGLTPKFKDVSTLVDILTYNCAPINKQKLTPIDYPNAALNPTATDSGSAVLLYDPPIEEFSIVHTILRGDGAKASFEALNGPSIVICTSGEGTISVGSVSAEMKEGYVFFVGALVECILEASGNGDKDFTSFKALCEGNDSKVKNARGLVRGG